MIRFLRQRWIIQNNKLFETRNGSQLEIDENKLLCNAFTALNGVPFRAFFAFIAFPLLKAITNLEIVIYYWI